MGYINKIGKQLDAIKNSELGTAARSCARKYMGTVRSSVEHLLSENENKQCDDVPKKAARLAADGAKLACKGAKKICKGTAALAAGTREMVEELSSDVDSVIERDPAARSRAEVLLLYSGLHAVAAYRVAHKLNEGGHQFSARLISQTARFLTGIEIHPGATIGKGLFIDHGSGVVIGETAEIGDNCTLYQGVTLGGTGKHTGKRHPTLGNNVMVGAGAKVLGPFSIGDNSKIAAGAVVLDEVPSDSTAVGIPARVVRREGVRVEETGSDLDQINIPDPIDQELRRLRDRISVLEEITGEALSELDSLDELGESDEIDDADELTEIDEIDESGENDGVRGFSTELHYVRTPDEALWDDAEHRDNKAETDEADPDKAYSADAEDGYEDLDGDDADGIAPDRNDIDSNEVDSNEVDSEEVDSNEVDGGDSDLE